MSGSACCEDAQLCDSQNQLDQSPKRRQPMLGDIRRSQAFVEALDKLHKHKLTHHPLHPLKNARYYYISLAAPALRQPVSSEPSDEDPVLPSSWIGDEGWWLMIPKQTRFGYTTKPQRPSNHWLTGVLDDFKFALARGISCIHLELMLGQIQCTTIFSFRFYFLLGVYAFQFHIWSTLLQGWLWMDTKVAATKR